MIDVENLKCNYCNTTYSVLSSLKLHCQTGQKHNENVIKSGIPQDISSIKKIKVNKIAENNRLTKNNKVIAINGICKVPTNVKPEHIENMIDVKNLKCNYCNITVKNMANLRDHCFNTKKHLNNVERSNIPQDLSILNIVPTNVAAKNIIKRNDRVIYKKDYCKVPLNNGTFLIIDTFIFNIIKKYTFNHLTNDYTRIMVNKKSYYIHRYIYYILFHRSPRIGYQVDHKNHNPLDVRVKNLREFLPSENVRNSVKSKNVTSKYNGVSYDTKYDNWVCRLKLSNETLRISYKKEIHAAYHFNLMVIENDLDYCTPLNNIEKPIDFIRKELYSKKNNLPKGITKQKNRYIIKFKGKQYYKFKTLEDAIFAYNKKVEDFETNRINKILNMPIIRNKDGVPIIVYYNKKSHEKYDIMVDAHRYHELIMYTTGMSRNYVTITIDKRLKLSRYLLNCYDPTKHVDHIDNNPLNNQMNNLRIVSALYNSQNKSSLKNSTSKYVGVSFTRSWVVTINNVNYYKFKNETEAVHFRDIKAYELNLLGNYFKINLPEELQVNLFLKSLLEESFNFQYLFY